VKSKLLILYRQRVAAIARRVSRRTPHYIEYDDLVQTGLIAVWRTLERYGPDYVRLNPSLLDRCILNAMINHNRYQGRLVEGRDHRTKVTRAPMTSIVSLSSNFRISELPQLQIHPRVDEEIDRQRTLACIDRALPRLNERRRTIIKLLYTNERPMTMREAGMHIGRSAATICREHKEAILKLRRLTT
jgi:RNA polymerase sigma factor (sigma-70 family)